MSEMNTFFSGSVKIFWDSLPFFYPSNLNINSKGELIDPTTSTMDAISTNSTTKMKGYIPAATYNGI